MESEIIKKFCIYCKESLISNELSDYHETCYNELIQYQIYLKNQIFDHELLKSQFNITESRDTEFGRLFTNPSGFIGLCSKSFLMIYSSKDYKFEKVRSCLKNNKLLGDLDYRSNYKINDIICFDKEILSQFEITKVIERGIIYYKKDDFGDIAGILAIKINEHEYLIIANSIDED